MNTSPNFRFLLATTVLLAVLAGAYEAAVHGSLSFHKPKTARLKSLSARANDLAEDSAARRVAPLPAPASPAASVAADSLAQAQEKAASQRKYDSLAQEYHARLRDCPPGPLRFRETRRTDPPAPRRYVGTVGGQPATAELSWVRPDSLVGRFYFWHSNAEYSLASHRSTRVLALQPAYPYFSRDAGRWHLTRPAGPVLQGYWEDSTGRRGQPFVLRENYQGGVRYEIRKLTLTGGQTSSSNPCSVPVNSRDFLHLLGPAINQPPLSRVQCPAVAGRRRVLYNNHDNASCSERVLEVQLNDFGLLSYQLHYLDSPFEGTGDFGEINVLIDLASGRHLVIYHQFRPGYELPLRHLLAQQLPHDSYHSWGWVSDHGRRVKLPILPYHTSDGDNDVSETFVLAAQGLKIGHHDRYDFVTIPYPELRPLVRPGTPLARMLRARGMW